MNVAIDLDGTLASWDGDGRKCGEWLPGAREAVRLLLERDVAVIVHTCRTNWEAGGAHIAVVEFLKSGGFDPVLVSDSWSMPGGTIGVWVGSGKPVAKAYVDDKALKFHGHWADTINDLWAMI